MVRFSTIDRGIFPRLLCSHNSTCGPYCRGWYSFNSITWSRRHTLIFWNQNLRMSVSFTVIGSCVASRLKFIDKVRLKDFRNTIFKSKSLLPVPKIILSLQNFVRLLIHLFSFFLVILEILPKYSNSILNFNFGTVVSTDFWTNIVYKFCYAFVNKFCGVSIFWSVFLIVSTSKRNLEKSDTIVKLFGKNVYTKPNLCSSAPKLL